MYLVVQINRDLWRFTMTKKQTVTLHKLFSVLCISQSFSSYLRREMSCTWVDTNTGAESETIWSHLFIIPSISSSYHYSNFGRLAVACINTHYSLTESIKFVIPNVRTLNIPYSIVFLSRYLLLRFPPWNKRAPFFIFQHPDLFIPISIWDG